ncbi:MAG: hypothetical protein HZB54_09975 [Deltaproteobacteria bacterium]|nr:hypothetical protein [Deltaproteobacteria bacterium]
MIQFTHYTQKIEAIEKILKNGFAYVPNKRSLITEFLPSHDFTKREPQQFGMVSFTELSPSQAENHRKVFGNYGIVVSEKWALAHKIQKVLYIDNTGPIYDCLRNLFQVAYNELKQKSLAREGEVTEMAYTNKVRAGIAGGYLYSNLLQLYEYMEPIKHLSHQEWRIVHPKPYYGYGETKADIISNVSPPKGWAQFLNVLPVKTDDIIGFICPENEQDIFKKTIPSEFTRKPIDIYLKPA